MANEFRHEDVGGQLSKAEWEAINLHRFASQATGDILYASSGTQLSRLAKGTSGQILGIGASIPAWTNNINGMSITNDGTKTTFVGIEGDYNRVGDASSTGHSLATNDDWMITGKLEVSGVAYIDGRLNLPGTTTAEGIVLGAASLVDGCTMNLSGGSLVVQCGQKMEFRFDSRDLGSRDWEIQEGSGGTPRFTINSNTAILGGIDLDLAANFASFTEMAAPGAGAANTARVYAVVDGGSLTDLCAVFQDGSIDIFAQETTEEDSPIYRYPDNTGLELKMRRPDEQTHQFVAVFPDGSEFVLKELWHPKEEK